MDEIGDEGYEDSDSEDEDREDLWSRVEDLK